MRYAVISDIHANLHALQAALDFLKGERVDHYLVAGDLVGYGPLPDECVEVVAGLGGTCVAGNHDLIALGVLSDERCIPLARRSLRWTRDTMRPQTRDFLATLPPRATAGDEIVVAHGSLTDPREYTTEPSQAVAQLKRLEHEHPGRQLLILGHTHRAWACTGAGDVLAPGHEGSLDLSQARTCVLNPGAVGQSRERSVRSRFMVLDVDERLATFHAIEYDVEGCRRALRERGLPEGSYRLRRSVLRGAARVARRALRVGRPR